MDLRVLDVRGRSLGREWQAPRHSFSTVTHVSHACSCFRSRMIARVPPGILKTLSRSWELLRKPNTCSLAMHVLMSRRLSHHGPVKELVSSTGPI